VDPDLVIYLFDIIRFIQVEEDFVVEIYYHDDLTKYLIAGGVDLIL